MSNQNSTKPRDNPAHGDRDSGRRRVADLIPPKDATAAGFLFSRSLLAQILVLLGIGIGAGMGPPGVETLRRTLMLLPFVLAALLAIADPDRRSRILAVLVLGAAMLLSSLDGSPRATPLIGVALLGSLALLSRQRGLLDPDLLRAGQILLLLSFAAQSIDAVWYGLEDLAAATSLFVPMSAEWSGLMPALFILVLGFLRFTRPLRIAVIWQTLLLAALAIVLVQSVALALASQHLVLPKATMGLAATRALGLLGFLAALPLARPGLHISALMPARPFALAPTLAVGVLLSLTPLLGFGHESRSGSVDGARVLVLDFGSAIHDFRRPVVENPGLARAGTYGLMEALLERWGAEVRRCSGWPAAADLEETDVVIALVPNVMPQDDQVADLERYVARGGGLLFAGDHTDLLDSMKPANAALAAYGIEFAFDTAVETHAGFAGDLLVRDIGILPVDLRATDLQILHGASLRCRAPARPLIVGRGTFSDHGDRRRPGKDAFLGDYAFHLGEEELGGQVLAAATEHGEGRVLVFGDSSSFQNLALARSQELLHDLVSHLRGRSTQVPVAAFLALAAVLVLLAGGLSWERGALILTFGLLASALTLVADSRASATSAAAVANARVLVHDGNLPFHDRASFQKRSLTGLLVMFERYGLATSSCDLNEVERLEDAEVVAIVAPTQALSSALRERLDAFLAAGGRLILACGFEQRQALAPYLASHGLSIADRPLGAAPMMDLAAARDHDGPRFVSAWPIERSAPMPGDEVLSSVDGEILVLSRKLGKGTLIVVGDSEFFIDRNFEDERQRQDENVGLWLQMLGQPGEEKGESR